MGPPRMGVMAPGISNLTHGKRKCAKEALSRIKNTLKIFPGWKSPPT